jgi:hypothetical protein
MPVDLSDDEILARLLALNLERARNSSPNWLEVANGQTQPLARPIHRDNLKEFVESGAKISGFRESRWKSVQSIKRGDYLLCYLTGVSRFIGVLK